MFNKEAVHKFLKQRVANQELELLQNIFIRWEAQHLRIFWHKSYKKIIPLLWAFYLVPRWKCVDRSFASLLGASDETVQYYRLQIKKAYVIRHILAQFQNLLVKNGMNFYLNS
jgi:hypothetical protein